MIYEMRTIVLDSEELSLLRTCVALVLGGVFQNEVVATSVSNIIKKKNRKLQELYSKLELSQQKKRARKNSSKPQLTTLSHAK
jgi:ABC-type tungstate transport system substrate-binding protein